MGWEGGTVLAAVRGVQPGRPRTRGYSAKISLIFDPLDRLVDRLRGG